MARPCDRDAYPLYRQIIGPIRDRARVLGYAVGVHGTLRRDIDLIACPWSEGAVEPEVIAAHVRDVAEFLLGYAQPDPLEAPHPSCAMGCPGGKPHGRRTWTFWLSPERGCPYIDLSVMPMYAVEYVLATQQVRRKDT